MAPGDGYVSGVLPGMLVTSLGCGVCLPALTVAAVSGTTEENAGLGSAVLTSVQQVGGAVGVALLVALAARHGDAATGTESARHAATEGYATALTVTAALVVLGAVLVALLAERRPGTADRSGPGGGR